MSGPRNAETTLGGRTYTFRGLSVPSVTTILKAYPKPGLLVWSAKEAAKLAVAAIRAGKTSKDVLAQLAEDAWHAHEATITHQTRHKKTCDFTPDVVNWIAGAHTRIRDEAGARGTDVHEAAEHDADLSDVPEKAQAAYLSYRQWVEDYQPVILAKEFQVFDDTDEFGGSGDLIAEVNGSVFLIDLKTSKSMHNDTRLQLAAYRYALICIVGDEYDDEAFVAKDQVERTAILHLTDEGYSFVEVEAGFEEYQRFTDVKRIWEFAAANDDRKGVGVVIKPPARAA